MFCVLGRFGHPVLFLHVIKVNAVKQNNLYNNGIFN